MGVDTPKVTSNFTRRHPGGSPTPSNESQKSALTEAGSVFERILDVVEEAGFDSIDMMAAQYYSAKFQPNSISQLAQANSRSRDLRRLLQTLQKTAKQWSKHETQAYEEEIVKSAKNICRDELRLFRERQVDRLTRRPSLSRTESAPGSSYSGSMTGQNRRSTGTVDQLSLLLRKEESSQPTQQEKRLLRQCLPETWSLLSELARESDLPPAQVSQAVYTFLHMTTASTAR